MINMNLKNYKLNENLKNFIFKIINIKELSDNEKFDILEDFLIDINKAILWNKIKTDFDNC